MSAVYAISDGRAIKIGFAVDPVKRLADLQIAHSQPLRLIHSRACSDAAKAERRAHRLLREKRLRGEWFDLSEQEAVFAIDLAIMRDTTPPRASRKPKPRAQRDGFFRPFIDLWPIRNDLARDIEQLPVTVQQWWGRDSIPARHFRAIETAAAKRGFAGVTEVALLEAFLAKRGRA